MPNLGSAVYFNRAEEILRREETPKIVTMQVFQKKENTVLCGMSEVVTLLELVGVADTCEIKHLNDGDIVQPWEPVLTIRGDLAKFVCYESVYLGILARSSKVATNTRRVVDAAKGKPVLFFADRFDRPENQVGDGYAATIGGASAVCTSLMANGASLAQDKTVEPIGTMPHALIAAYDGDVVEACKAFRKTFPEVPLHALVDFNNNCVVDSLRCVQEFGKDLAGVRLDTSENMVDVSVLKDIAEDPSYVGDFKPTGVNPRLVHNVRHALDDWGGSHVKITVSGGFTAEKIADFEAASVPVDNYAVGSSLLKGNIDFTADVVYPVAKAGRRLRKPRWED